ncbi:MAG: 1-deoxy-D-xylulose-5-phosphate reductoisomerase [Oscillospiraceae bacterium]|nr:1-deoxy-D-xylulose-5-phosphate reductoisomerase [Oscillospiraceae bacterium]
MKTLTILGSTGSIGTQTLEVAASLGYKVIAMTAHSNLELFEQQKNKFKPETAILSSEPGGEDKLIDIAKNSGADIIVTAISGMAGLAPTLAACETGKRIALANKEPLVCAGEQVMQTARRYGTEIIPVDSEHSAIFQCIENKTKNMSRSSDEGKCLNEGHQISKLILTASGGPFRGKTRKELENITPKEALRHPNWNMGEKISIDSATMMNKGLELIEAMHLFSMPPDKIEVIIHPESIIHSMVEYTDGSVIAQLSTPDMRLPIQYALTYPERKTSLTKPINFAKLGKLTFEKPDPDTFPCLELAYRAAKQGPKTCRILNEANEEAVELFLNGKIGFLEIPQYIEDRTNKCLL